MTLNKILAFDALTCALMGALLILFAPALAAWLGLPRDLLFYAGWLLIPVALFMALLARGTPPWMGGVWLVILGNAGWVLASLGAKVISVDKAPLAENVAKMDGVNQKMPYG